MYVDAQNETQPQDASLTETNRACANNVTNDMNYICELDTANVKGSLDIITETKDPNSTTEIMNLESTLSTEAASLGNVTEFDLSVTISTVKSDIQKTQYSEATTEAIPANEVCTCDLNVCMYVCICNTF
jgi:hypothetical protein